MRRLVAVVVLLAVAGCGVRPSGVIPGVDAPDGPVEGTVLFLVSAGRPTAVVRPNTVVESKSEAIALLAAGPTEQERAQDLTSEVPSDAAPADVSNTLPPERRPRRAPPRPPGHGDAPPRPPGHGGVTVKLSTNVSELSKVAIEQIACTAAAEHPVTVEGKGRRRGPVTCPV